MVRVSERWCSELCSHQDLHINTLYDPNIRCPHFAYDRFSLPRDYSTEHNEFRGSLRMYRYKT